MFNAISIQGRQTSRPKEPIDLGFLAEAMLFYQDVHLITDNASLEQLIKYCGAELLWELVSENFLKIDYLDTGFGLARVDPSKQVYSAMTFSTPEWKLEKFVPTILTKTTGKSKKSRILSSHLIERIQQVPITKEKIIEIFQEDLTHKEYIEKSIIQILRSLTPDYQLPSHFQFNIKDANKGFSVDTNLEFVSRGGEPQLVTPKGITSITPSSFLLLIAEAKQELYISSLYESEIASSPLTSAIIQEKCNDLLSRRKKNENSVEMFQNQTINNGRAIREAINSGERNYKDLLVLLRRANNFRHWLQKLEPSDDLIKSYYQEITSPTWAEKLPVKVLRWAVLTASGMALLQAPLEVSLGVPAALSIVDTFFLDKLFSGWKPNQFVEKSLKPFIDLN